MTRRVGGGRFRGSVGGSLGASHGRRIFPSTRCPRVARGGAAGTPTLVFVGWIFIDGCRESRDLQAFVISPGVHRVRARPGHNRNAAPRRVTLTRPRGGTPGRRAAPPTPRAPAPAPGGVSRGGTRPAPKSPPIKPV